MDKKQKKMLMESIAEVEHGLSNLYDALLYLSADYAHVLKQARSYQLQGAQRALVTECRASQHRIPLDLDASADTLLTHACNALLKLVIAETQKKESGNDDNPQI